MEFEKLKRIIGEVLHADEDSISMETNFMDDLGADSLDLFQIVLAIEKEFDIEIPQERMASIRQMKDAVECIRHIAG
ncbi:MAG TPA: acyl carrier protein [Candidatus Scybalocola faecigallinarum]|uniref:Acyl carrier protein n=1 Tax=Candidatus Scybalocola faecigallinarum TaxID=2840941 RepID=A0A9D1F654_9FIRM|nr:acyl carrier protein [Candidatus Scybalocola faecigallinarum]